MVLIWAAEKVGLKAVSWVVDLAVSTVERKAV